MLNVFHRDGDTIRHFWGSELFYAPVDPGQEPRHVGTIEPLWNLFDLTPEGRPATWHEQFSYWPPRGARTRITRIPSGPARTGSHAHACSLRSSPAASTSQARGNTRTIERRPGQRAAGCEAASPGWHRARSGHIAAVVFVLVDDDGQKTGSREVSRCPDNRAGNGRLAGSSGWDRPSSSGGPRRRRARPWAAARNAIRSGSRTCRLRTRPHSLGAWAAGSTAAISGTSAREPVRQGPRAAAGGGRHG